MMVFSIEIPRPFFTAFDCPIAAAIAKKLGVVPGRVNVAMNRIALYDEEGDHVEAWVPTPSRIANLIADEDPPSEALVAIPDIQNWNREGVKP